MPRKKKEKTLLELRCEEWGIPVPRTQPLSNDVLVWRLPPLSMTKGGIIIPDDSESPNVKGLLIAAGFKAMDDLEREGIRLGHIVIFKRFAGWEHEMNMDPGKKTPEHKRHNTFLHLKVSDILTSDDLYEDIKAGRTRVSKDETGRRVIEQKPTAAELAEFKKTERKRKLLARAADTSSPREAEIARRIVEGAN